MEQPKFNFGDWVTDGQNCFQVGLIKVVGDEDYVYGDIKGESHLIVQDDLQSCKEPNTIKYFAYQIKGTEDTIYSINPHLERTNGAVMRNKDLDKAHKMETLKK